MVEKNTKAIRPPNGSLCENKIAVWYTITTAHSAMKRLLKRKKSKNLCKNFFSKASPVNQDVYKITLEQ